MLWDSFGLVEIKHASNKGLCQKTSYCRTLQESSKLIGIFPWKVGSGVGVFRNHNGERLGCFAQSLPVSIAYHVELQAAMLGIEIAFRKGWRKIWLECDSWFAVQSFKDSNMIPWKLKTRWNNCIFFTKAMQFEVSHIYIEGNCCADGRSKFALQTIGFSWWDSPPSFIREPPIVRDDRFGLPNYVFVNFLCMGLGFMSPMFFVLFFSWFNKFWTCLHMIISR